MIQANFPPKLDVYPLSEADFKQQEKPLSPAIRVRMSENSFYLVNIPINFILPLGYSLNRLECTLEFCPEDNNPKQQPVIYDVYPKSETVTMLDLSGDLQILLYENLLFLGKITNINQESTDIVPQAEAKLTTYIKSGISFTVNSLNYQCYRQLIKAIGKGNSRAVWQFDGKKSLLGQEILLSVILMIPKTRLKPVDAAASLTANYHFEWLTANILQDYPKRLTNNHPNPIKLDYKWFNITNLPFLNLHPWLTRFHDQDTGKLKVGEIGQILGFSQENMSILLNCTLKDLENDDDNLQSQLFPVYLFIKNFLETIPTLDENEFKRRLNIPTAAFFPHPSLKDYKSLKMYLLERDFDHLRELIELISQQNP